MVRYKRTLRGKGVGLLLVGVVEHLADERREIWRHGYRNMQHESNSQTTAWRQVLHHARVADHFENSRAKTLFRLGYRQLGAAPYYYYSFERN